MERRTERAPRAGAAGASAARRVSKKEQILSLFTTGIEGIDELATLTDSKPSYVGSVLQQAGLVHGYFDLYTSSTNPMNVYSKYFAGHLGYRDVETARASLAHINMLYTRFGEVRDRAGQHHALAMALMVFNRARWTGKRDEAAIFRQWLIEKLSEATPIEDMAEGTEQQF